MGEDASLDDFLDDDQGADRDETETERDDGEAETASEDADPAAESGEGETVDSEEAVADDDGATSDDAAQTTDDETAEGGTDPAVATYDWTPGGAACAACDETVERRWRDDPGFVCEACKDW